MKPVLGGVDVPALKRAHRVADVVASYGVRLRPSGRALVGRCPFHDDRETPNLHVYPKADGAEDDWFCYRCGAHGDVISFVMRWERVKFPEACALLAGRPARRAGRAPVVPPAAPPRRVGDLSPAEQAVMDAAAAVYQERLWATPRALAYVRRRGVADRVLERARVGYADGRSLVGHLTERRGVEAALALGLLRPGVGDRPPRELLAGRVVVPELRRGHCVWFIGRRIEDRRRGRPYLATPGERPLLGLENLAGRRVGFVLEDVFGYLTALGWDLPASSLCGTAFPADRLDALDHLARLYGVFDPDAAGRAAAERLAAHFGARWRSIRLPDGRDLDELGLRPDGRRTFFRLLAAARNPNTNGGLL